MTKRDEHNRRSADHRNPPQSTRFRKGQSGNPKGRPKGHHRKPPYEAVLGQLVTVREGGAERRITAAEAFILHLTKRGLEGDSSAARATMRLIDEMRDHGIVQEPSQVVVRTITESGSVNTVLQILNMAKLFDPFRDTAYTLLEPWIVEAALARLGNRRLTADQQRIITRATRTPYKVRWPEWWEAGT